MLNKSVTDLHGNPLPDSRIVVSAIDYFTEKARTFRGTTWDPIGIDLSETIRFNQELLFQITMAHARDNDIEFISIDAQDFIAPRYKEKRGPFEGDIFAWDLCKHYGFHSCGNGRGDHCGQYQISGIQYFGADNFGVWDPKTEELITGKAFSLRTHSVVLEGVLSALRKGNITEYMETDQNFRTYHANLDYSTRW